MGATRKHRVDAKETCEELSVTPGSVQQVGSVWSASLTSLFSVTIAAHDACCISDLVQFVLHCLFCLKTLTFSRKWPIYTLCVQCFVL